MDEIIEMDVQTSTDTNIIEDVEMKTPPEPEPPKDDGVDEVDASSAGDGGPVEQIIEVTPVKVLESRTIEDVIKSIDIEVKNDHKLEIEVTENANVEDVPKLLEDTADIIAEPETQLIPNIKSNELEYFKGKRLVEIARCSWNSSYYLRGCLWSPDGTCCLSIVNGDGMHLFELPSEFYECTEIESERPFNVLDSVVHVPEGGTVYDCSWYPSMHSMMPETCCWAATRQHEPIHLWDAFDGKLRCSYRGYNDFDEVESAISVAFSLDGLKIYSGFRKSLKIFTTTVPGKDCESYKTNCPISSIAINIYDDNVVALGSWNKSIFLCDPRDYELNSAGALLSHSGGVTYMKFLSQHTLVSGARKDNQILKWDLRFPNEPIKIYERTVTTNQRIYFDISPEQNWLATGNTDGKLSIWNLDDKAVDTDKITFPVHHDCCNGISFHPYKKIMSTSTGQFHESVVAANGVDDTDLDSRPEENSLIFWWFGDVLFNK